MADYYNDLRQYWKALGRITIVLTPYVVLITATALAFGGALRGSFHLEDFSLLANPSVTQASGFYRIWSPMQLHPLTYLTFWLNFTNGGTDPFGYHLINLVLHCFNVLLLFYLLQRLLNRNAALIASVFFAVHPIQSEAVAYVSARGLLLGTSFCLISWLLWLHGKQWASVTCFGLSLLAMIESATFPLVLLLASSSLKTLQPKDWRPLKAMFGLSALAATQVLVINLVNSSGLRLNALIEAAQYFTKQGWAVLRYLRLLVIPIGLTAVPDVRVNAQWIYVVAWIVIAAICAISWRYKQDLKEGFWTVAGMVLLIPSSSIFPFADLAGDQRMYLPMIAFTPLFGLLCLRMSPAFLPVYPPRNLFAQNWRVWILIAVGLSTMFSSAMRMESWRTEKALLTEATQTSPREVRPFIQLAHISGTIEALDLMLQAKHVSPDNSYVRSQVGLLWLKLGDPREALAEFDRALSLDPNNPRTLSNHGAALVAMHQERAAMRDFEAALRLDPCYRAARLNIKKIGAEEKLLPVCHP